MQGIALECEMKLKFGHPNAGFTLVETLLASVILAMSIMAVTMPFTVGAQNEQVDARRTLATSLAQEIMEEILAKPFPAADSQPGTTETDRTEFQDMLDYHGYTEAVGNITSYEGGVIVDPAATSLSRYVTVAFVYVSGQDTLEDPTFVQITSEISYRGHPVCTLTRLAYGEPEGGEVD